MNSIRKQTAGGSGTGWRTKSWRIAILAGVLAGSTGCVQVTAPDKPIEIVLTINIRQEVVYRLDSDAKALIEQNAEIF
ncbi:YnbE family lipoprotein [Sphingomonas lacunae]|uniref:YnbE family lipoprotein n=1 Tax=Sphingomonas lacunae TaxID=2698828 RepID=A0A6M4AWY0_9SPHN|nr:YnbE family lipoprotein [Sphingomonas lacunae]QJQ32852.1 YnbE family lipoprotein [Sphingomonas lacunae]